MAQPWIMSVKALDAIVEGNVRFFKQKFNMALYTPEAVVTPERDYSQLIGEVVAEGYTKGGQDMGNLTTKVGWNTFSLLAPRKYIQWTAKESFRVGYAVIYNPLTGAMMCYSPIGSVLIEAENSITVSINEKGVFSMPIDNRIARLWHKIRRKK